MTIEEKLQNYIKEKYRSINDFCTINEIPSSTVYTILKRGVLNSNVGSIIKVCDALDISVDALSRGEIKSRGNLVPTKIEYYESRNTLDHMKKLLDKLENEIINKKGSSFIPPDHRKGKIQEDLLQNLNEEDNINQ